MGILPTGQADYTEEDRELKYIAFYNTNSMYRVKISNSAIL